MSSKGLALDGAELGDQLERCHRAGYGRALSCCGRDPLEAEEVLQIVLKDAEDPFGKADPSFSSPIKNPPSRSRARPN